MFFILAYSNRQVNMPLCPMSKMVYKNP